MKKIVLIMMASLLPFLIQPAAAFDFKGLIKEQKEVLVDLKNDIVDMPKRLKSKATARVDNEKNKARARVDYAKNTPARKRAELQSRANYIKNSPQRIKQQEKLKYQQRLNEQKRKTAVYKRKIDLQRQRVNQLKNKPGAERDRAQRQYRQMLNAERRRLQQLRKL